MINYEFAFLLGAIVLLIYLVTALFRKISADRIITGCLFIAYLTAVVSITLFPIPYDEKVEYFGEITWYNFIPFGTITNMLGDGIGATTIIQIAGNIFMAVPYGVFVMLFIKNKKWWKLLILALLFTVSIEFLQFIIGAVIDNMYRTVDVDDVILNASGAYIGYGIYKILPNRLKRLY